jgi:polar amino acid transport system substrate-binding protein
MLRTLRRSTSHVSTSHVAVVMLIAGLTLSVSACTQNSDESLPESVDDASTSVGTPATLTDSLITPGVLTVAVFDDSPPSAFYAKDGRLIGWEVELANGIAQQNGLDVTFIGGNFDSVLNAVADGKADIGIASMFNTAERQKRVDFVNYFIGGTSWAAAADSGFRSIKPCGSRVGAITGSAQFTDYLQRVDRECLDGGLDPLEIVGYESIIDAVADLETGRLNALVADDPVVAQLAGDSFGRIVVTDSFIEPQPYGIATPLGRDELRDSVQSALEEMSVDGAYRNILGRWAVESGSVERFTTNGAVTTTTK